MEILDGTMDWLLEEDNPPFRYLTLKNLLGKPARSSEVTRAKSRLMEYNVTQGILQHAPDSWDDGERAYWKYTGKYWQLIFLGQFLADGKDPRIAKAVHDIVDERKWVQKNGGHCLTANMLAALARLGYGNHRAVKQETEALAARVLAEDGIKCMAMDYSLLSRCYMAQPKLLLSFAQVPPKKRSSTIAAAIQMLVENLLQHEVYVYAPGNVRQWQEIVERAPKRAELPKGKTVKGWIGQRREQFLATKGIGERRPKQGWLRFGFPLHYNSDILEATYALAALGIPMSPKLKKPLKVIQDKRTSDGKWIMQNSLNGKMLADVEEKGKPSKWLTYFACYVLNHFERG
jgi:hypothetical protein